MHPVKSYIQQRIQAVWFYIQITVSKIIEMKLFRLVIIRVDFNVQYITPGSVVVLINVPIRSVSFTGNGRLLGIGNYRAHYSCR